MPYRTPAPPPPRAPRARLRFTPRSMLLWFALAYSVSMAIDLPRGRLAIALIELVVAAMAISSARNFDPAYSWPWDSDDR